jgi:flavin-dependent dehydrogenase
VTPVGTGLFGVAILSSTQAPYDDQLRAFPLLQERLRGNSVASEVRGAGPLRHRTRRRVAGRVLLVGDAAGYLDALTGEGIGVALSCARGLVACLASGRPDEYEKAWYRASRRSRALTSGLLAARRSPVITKRIVPAAQCFPGIFGRAVQLLAG